MPRYYGQQIDPLEMQQMAGNPFYNPELSRPDWYRGIMSLYANLKGAKEEKEAKRISAEDREWTRLYKQLELNLKKQQLEQGAREYETPEQRADREAKNRTLEHKYRLAEIALTLEGQGKKAELAQAKVEDKETFVDKKRIYDEASKARAAKLKEHRDLATKISAIERRIGELKPKAAKALMTKDKVSAAAFIQEMERLESERSALEGQRENFLNDIMKPEVPTKKEETKIIDGVTFYKWSDGKWRDSKESTPTKK